MLTTLLILALLAVFMTEFSFETNLETRSIKNYQASFKSKNAVKSIFKAVLEGIEKQDEIKFFREYVKGLITIGNNSSDISFLNPKIEKIAKILPYKYNDTNDFLRVLNLVINEKFMISKPNLREYSWDNIIAKSGLLKYLRIQ